MSDDNDGTMGAQHELKSCPSCGHVEGTGHARDCALGPKRDPRTPQERVAELRARIDEQAARIDEQAARIAELRRRQPRPVTDVKHETHLEAEARIKRLRDVARAAEAERRAEVALILMEDTDMLDGKIYEERLQLSVGWTAARNDAREARCDALDALQPGDLS